MMKFDVATGSLIMRSWISPRYRSRWDQGAHKMYRFTSVRLRNRDIWRWKVSLPVLPGLVITGNTYGSVIRVRRYLNFRPFDRKRITHLQPGRYQDRRLVMALKVHSVTRPADSLHETFSLHCNYKGGPVSSFSPFPFLVTTVATRPRLREVFTSTLVRDAWVEQFETSREPFVRETLHSSTRPFNSPLRSDEW